MSSISENYSSVSNFYKGKSVFITGATGFLGKVLVEKLLYDCSEIQRIYILTRAKKDRSPSQRVQEFINSPVFQRLKRSRPDDLNKIIPVAGELTALDLGLNAEDKETLLEDVSVVFHVAATVNLNEPLRVAMAVNLEGTIKVLDLCKRMRNICALVHVSTAYCNTDQKVVEERVYPPAANIEDAYKFIEQYGDDDTYIDRILNGRPNTYSFSKSLAEAYLSKNHGDVPTVIVRPSIISAAVNEPLEGWVDGWQGLTVILTSSARGFYRAIFCDGDGVAGIIPVDYVANMTIVAAAQSKNEKVSVYNCCTSVVNPISWRTIANRFIEVGKADNFSK